jgi:hypothetical protein
MTKIYTTIVLVIVYLTTNAQAPSWAWAKGAGGAFSYGIATDTLDNVYVTGNYDKDSITFGNFTLINAGDSGAVSSNRLDFFIVKYDASGNVLWAKSAGGTGDDSGQSIATDAAGNIYVTGYFISSSITFGTTTLTNAGSNDIFVVKYDAQGNVLWAKREGGAFGDRAFGISTDASNNVIVTGYYCNQITFGSYSINNPGFNNSMFVVKYNSSGNALWANGSLCTGFNSGASTTTDASGNVYVTGFYSASSITFGTTTYTNAGARDMFTVKYNDAGVLQWAKHAGGTGNESGYGIKSDLNGNVYVTGYFNSPSIIIGADTLTNYGINDIYLIKYDVTGNELWYKAAGNSGEEQALSITSDSLGNVYIIGFTSSPSLSFGTVTLTNNGTNFIFVAKYDAFGNTIWVKEAEGNNFGFGQGITLDSFGNLFVTGTYSSSITFGTYPLSFPGVGLYVAKLGNNVVNVEENFLSTKIMENCIITNALGQIVYNSANEINANHKIQINISNLSAGVYFVKVRSSNGAYTAKFIKSE